MRWIIVLGMLYSVGLEAAVVETTLLWPKVEDPNHPGQQYTPIRVLRWIPGLSSGSSRDCRMRFPGVGWHTPASSFMIFVPARNSPFRSKRRLWGGTTAMAGGPELPSRYQRSGAREPDDLRRPIRTAGRVRLRLPECVEL